MNVHTKLASLALPLALSFALAQGGSCGGVANVRNANANRNTNVNGNANVAANVYVNVNANTNVNAHANTNAGANADTGAGAGTNVNVNNVNMDSGRKGAETDPGAGGEGKAGVVDAGSWGGRGVQLDVSADGARVEFDCAHGSMGKLSAGAGGTFEAKGVFVPERGGPVHVDQKEEGHPALYSGKVVGKTMTLKVTLEGGEADSPLTFTLTRGREGRLTKCL